MQSADLKTLLDDPASAEKLLAQMKLSNLNAAHASLVAIAGHGVPLDLLEPILNSLQKLLPSTPDPDLGLKNLERFIVSSRSPMSLAALLVRDASALSDLVRIFSFSESLSDSLIHDPESFDLVRLTEGQPVSKDVLLEELRSEINRELGMRVAKNRLRVFKRRELLRIAYGEFVRKSSIEKTQQQLVYLAETICAVALEYCENRIQEKFGVTSDTNEHVGGLALIASQRFGASNLDYSNLLAMHALFDPRLLKIGSKTRPGEYFERLIEEFEDLLSEANEYGVCYQVKFEKKPNKGSKRVCDVDSAAKYFDQNATARDRLDLVYSSFICGDPRVAEKFFKVRKLTCFRHYFNRNEQAEFRSLKHGLQFNSSRSETIRNIKTGAGGIHDVEFTANYLQLLVGKKIPEIQQGDFFEVLFHLEKNEVITRQEFEKLRENYSYLRSVSHCLQLCTPNTTDVLPNNPKILERLRRQLIIHCEKDVDFDGIEKLTNVANENLRILGHLLQWSENENGIDWLEDFVLGSKSAEEVMHQGMNEFHFRQPTRALASIEELAHERHRFISSKRCRFFLSTIVSDLTREISETADPDQTLNRLVAVSDSLGGKGVLWELFAHNRTCLKLYVELCANAPYLVSILQANPGMLDELMDSLTLQRPIIGEHTREELDMACGSSADVEPIVLSFKNSEHLKIGVSQLIGHSVLGQVHEALAKVADCCIEKIASSEFEKLSEKHGLPWLHEEDRACNFGVVIGGKFGANEPNYHSNICFWILFEGEGKTQTRRNQTAIINQKFFSLLATRVAKSLTRIEAHGRLYELEKLPADFGGASTLALSLPALESRAGKICSSVSATTFLAQCRTLSNSSEFSRQAEDLLTRLLQMAELSNDSWERYWNHRCSLEKDASPYNLKRAVGGTLDVEAIVHFLYVASFDGNDRKSNTILMLEELINRKVVDSELGRKLLAGFELLKRIELFLRLMNLSKRHAFPVSEKSDQSEDGLISDQFAIAALNENVGGMNEVTDSDSIRMKSDHLKIVQSQLSAVMGYNRFETLLDEVEKCRKDNRRLTLLLAQSFFERNSGPSKLG